MKKLIIPLVVLAVGLSMTTTASAKGGGGHGGGHSSGGHSSGGHGSVGHASAGHFSTGRTGTGSRTMTRSGASVNRAMSSRTGIKTTQSLSSNAQRLNFGGGRSYASYARTPYSSAYYNNNHFSNVWFYYWLFSPNWSSSQRAIAHQNGLTQDTAKQLLANTKHVTIKDGDDKQVIIVTPKQYDAIHVGDDVSLVNNILKVNGKTLN